MPFASTTITSSLMETWAKRTSEAAGKNLAPFFNNYGFKLSQELVDELAGRFDKWEKDPTLPLPPDAMMQCVSGDGSTYTGTESKTATKLRHAPFSQIQVAFGGYEDVS